MVRVSRDEERGEPPDIDVDFEHARREEVLPVSYTHLTLPTILLV